MATGVPSPSWQTKLLKPAGPPRLAAFSQPLRPAELAESLCELILARQNVVEDVDYRKIVPNRFVVELPEDNYQRNYHLIEGQICQQWRERLLSHLTNANSRQGRQEYRFAGPVTVEIRPVSDLELSQARILFHLETGPASAPAPVLLPACLETLNGDRRFGLHEGIVTLGREATNDIPLDMPFVQEKKLVSGIHAYLRCTRGEYRLFDGTPRGQASTNGTFVNYRRVPPTGVSLREGDIILLAALNPNAPSLETPGAAVLRFRIE